MSSEDILIRALAPARDLEPTEAEVAAVVERFRPERRTRLSPGSGWRSRALAPALALLLLLASGYAAVPPLRAALQDAASTFADYVAGDDASPPGRALRPGESAAHGFRPEMDPRVIAEADGYQLQFVRMSNGTIEFDLGETGVALGFAVESLAGTPVYVLGPGAVPHADENGHVPLFGVTAPQVDAVELAYGSGPAARIDGVEGGFVLLAEPERNPQEVVAYDAAGDELGRASLQNGEQGVDIDWSAYGPAAPRVPIECQPGVAGANPPPGCPAP